MTTNGGQCVKRVDEAPAASEAGHSTAPSRPPSRRLLATVLLAATGVLAFGAYGHWQTNAAAEATQRDVIDFIPAVRAVTSKLLAEPVETTLPGETYAFDRANVFARATGYIAERKVDIGSIVKQGDVLVRIASPDLDRQLEQAVAQLERDKRYLQDTY